MAHHLILSELACDVLELTFPGVPVHLDKVEVDCVQEPLVYRSGSNIERKRTLELYASSADLSVYNRPNKSIFDYIQITYGFVKGKHNITVGYSLYFVTLKIPFDENTETMLTETLPLLAM